MPMENYYLYSNKIIDLNLPKYEREIAISLSRYFDENDLLQIQFNDLCLNFNSIINQERNNQNKLLYYYQSNTSKNTFSLIRSIDLSKNLIDYFIILELKSDFTEARIKCKIVDNIGSILNIIIGDSLNYINFGDITSNIYNKKQIMDKFSKILAKYCSLNNLFSARDKISNDIIDYDKMLDPTICNYETSFVEDDVTFEFNNFRFDTIYFGIKFNNISHYIYLNKSQVGFSSIYLMIDKAINFVNFLSQL